MEEEDGWTALHFAAQHNLPEVAKLLLEKGARVNAENKSKATPLDFAIAENGKEAADVLRQHGGICGLAEKACDLQGNSESSPREVVE